MAYLNKSQIVELARKTREIDEKPSAVLEPFYFRAFEKHAAKHPNDLNFIVELAKPGNANSPVGGNGFGVATCLEDYCWVDVRLGADPEQADGGKKNGFGSLWEYQNHCDTADHKKGRNERCGKSVTYLPAGDAPAAAAPPPAAAGPSRAAPAPATRAPSTSTATSSQASASKAAAPSRAMPMSSPFSQPRAGSSSSNILQPSTKQNLQTSSPAGRVDTKPKIDSKPNIAKSKSILAMLDDDDDEVSVVPPEEVPEEFRKVTNKGNPLELSDDEDDGAAPGPCSSAAAQKAPVAQATSSIFARPNLQPKSEPGAGPSTAAIVPGQPHVFVTPENLPKLQAHIRTMKSDRDVHVRKVYSALLTPVPGMIRTPAITGAINVHVNLLASLLYGPDNTPYPALPPLVSAAQPSLIPLDVVAKTKHDAYRKSAGELEEQITLGRARGILPPIGGFAVPPAQAAAVAAAVSAGVAPNAAIAAIAPGAYPNPHGLEGEALEDWQDEVYGGRAAPVGDLQTFFQDAINEFGEDQDIGRALTTLGLTSMDQRLGDMTVSLMPHQILGVSFMLEKERDRKYQGGLLCDAMGLGKTVQTIATICGKQSDDNRVKATLIVAPLAVLQQWKTEIESKTAEGTFKILIHHGQTKARSSKEFRSYDIVLTTYGTIVSEFAEPKQKRKKKKHVVDGLLPSDDDDEPITTKKKGATTKFRWYRVVLDEAHFIRNRNTQASKAVAELDAVYRWSLTGTLINNSLDDVFPHLRFLGISPQSEWAEFHKHISKRVKKNPKRAADRTQAILKTCMMRRHKDSVLNGQRLLNLPPKTTQEMELDFSPEERAIYDQVENRMKIKFGQFLKKGTVLKNMSCVLTMLMRLRQLTCHPWLLRRNPGDPAHPDDFVVSDEDLNLSMNITAGDPTADLMNAAVLLGEAWVADVGAKLKARYHASASAEDKDEDEKDNECSVCLDVLADETITECKHSFCRLCIDEIFSTPPGDGGDLTDEQATRGARKCPMCRSIIEKNKLFSALAFFDPENEEDDDDASGEASGSGTGADRKGKRKSLGDDSDYEEESPSAKKAKASKGKGKAKAVEVEEEEPMELDEIRNVLPSTKMKMLGELIDEYLAEDGIKVIVFSEFVTYLHLVERFLDNKGIPNRMYYGGMKNSDREDVIKEFTGPIKSERSPRVMLISRKAGGAGLNLTAASKVISLDLAWNAAAENQAVDRAHRIGQTRPVDIRRLIIKNSVEQRILALQEKKSALADGAMGEGTGGKLGRLTVQDLMRLFNYDDD